ncbi:VF530 family protein [uncultured Thiodictyon sp.]|uniref:VF530 family protein n=1 Tax=uncultured Thiodictyon sp. TaxID=1846217 RepID=UPI0025FA9AC9|nr:VF530 family protein [uncultured Thiodictyon sp.]
MTAEQPKNPLHGVTLEAVVLALVDHYGWDGLADKININCFKSEPSVKSSLKFLRKTSWAREQVEALYISTFTVPSTVWGNLPGANDVSSA